MNKEKKPKLGTLIIAPGVSAVESSRAKNARLFNPLCSGLEAPRPRAKQPNK